MRDLQRQAVTDALLEAAERVIADKGLANAAMADIARQAGVAVGTLYNYFPDRDGLVQVLVDTRRNAWGQAIRDALAATTGTFEARLRGFIGAVLRMFDENRRFVRILYENDLLSRGRNRTVPQTLQACMLELLRDGAAAGAVAKRDLELRARVLSSSMRAVVIHSLETRRPFAAETDAIVDLFLDGARPS